MTTTIIILLIGLMQFYGLKDDLKAKRQSRKATLVIGYALYFLTPFSSRLR